MNVTLYFVAENESDVEGSEPFDSFESAAAYSSHYPATTVYSVIATLDFSTIEVADG